MKHSNLSALGIVAVVAAWMLSGNIRTSLGAANEAPNPDEKATAAQVSIQVETRIATDITRQLVLQGQVEPFRSARLRAETSGRVLELPVQRGQRVKKDQLLVQLSLDDRNTRLIQARALLRQRQNELVANQSLQAKGLKAKNQVIQNLASVAAAEAELDSIEVELKNTRILAPFAGILEQRNLELGEFVDRADNIATIVDDSRVLLVGQVAQHNLAKLRLGQQVDARLITGQPLTGTLTYISTIAEAQTRSYRIEVEVPNPERKRWIGISASLVIPVTQLKAHHISAALLNLNSEGDLIVKTLSADNRVELVSVQIVRTDTNGVWVSGLPNQVTVITRGQGFYQQGDTLQSAAVARLPAVSTTVTAARG